MYPYDTLNKSKQPTLLGLPSNNPTQRLGEPRRPPAGASERAESRSAPRTPLVSSRLLGLCRPDHRNQGRLNFRAWQLRVCAAQIADVFRRRHPVHESSKKGLAINKKGLDVPIPVL